MSQSLLARPATDRRPSVDPEDVLAALSDTDCRRILDATSTPLTAREISEACDLPSSTTYRKVDLLTDAGLVEERLRLDREVPPRVPVLDRQRRRPPRRER